jgi:hypothetical protein
MKTSVFIIYEIHTVCSWSPHSVCMAMYHLREKIKSLLHKITLSEECIVMKGRRSNIKWGIYSTAFVLPANLEKGSQSTLAANRLLLVDPRGEISENDLLEFLEKFIEPEFWPWLKEKQVKM